jgi:predicted ester cyclase
MAVAARAEDIGRTARDFFEACETGRGWEGCRQWCHDGATFSAQAGALADMTTLRGYCDWMKGLLGPLPDGRYELKAFATDSERSTVVAAAVFHGTHSGEGGPVPPTGKNVAADYAYVMQFEGDRIRHMTKVWNDTWSLRALGWG